MNHEPDSTLAVTKTCHLIIEGTRADRPGWRLPAADLDRLVVTRLRAWLGDAAAVSEILDAGAHAASVHAAVIARARALADRWPTLSPHDATNYRAIDPPGTTIDFVLSGLRDAAAAKRLFEGAA